MSDQDHVEHGDDTSANTPQTRRAVLAAALGGAFASVLALVRAPVARAVDPNDVVLDGPNTGVGTTEITATSSNPAFRVIGGGAIVATGDAGFGLDAQSNTNHAIRGISLGGSAIRGRAWVDGVIGESTGSRSGVVGYSGTGGAAPAGPAKVGVYGEATQDTASRGVSGFSLAGTGVRGEATTGQGVRGHAAGGVGVWGEDTTGIGVVAAAAPGLALDVYGRARFSRSGKASIPVNKSYVDVTVPGSMDSSSFGLATFQVYRTGAWISAVRLNYPSTGKMRIYCNKIAHTTLSTPVAWMVFT